MSAPSKPNYGYQADKFRDARKLFMLPHPRGEQDAIFRAFNECRRGLRDLDRDKLRDPGSGWVRRLEELMKLNVRELDEGQQFEISRIIDELASWFTWTHSNARNLQVA
jgi:hypothetical protein